jgi:TonB family protein
MEWQDDEFETFLQQFRAPKPKALTVRRFPLRVVVLAAAVLLAIILPIGWWMGMTPRDDSSGGATSAPANISNPTTQKPLREIPLKHWQRPGYQASDANGGVARRRIREGDLINRPAQIIRVNPSYPEYAQAAGIEGVVILDVVLGEDGSVIEAWVSQSVPELDQAAIDAISQWRYEPTQLNGEPVEVEFVVTVHFTLQ